MKKIKSNRSRAVETAAGITSLPLSNDDFFIVGLAEEMHSSLNPVTGALAASVPMASGGGQIKSSGTKCLKEKMTMSKKAKIGREGRHHSLTTSVKPAFVAGLIPEHARGQWLNSSSGTGNHALNVQENLDDDYLIVMTILSQMENQFYYRPFGDDDATVMEFEGTDDVQRLQCKLAACRLLKQEIDESKQGTTSPTPQVVFDTLLSTQDCSIIGFKVIFEIKDPPPAGTEVDVIFTKLGVSPGPEKTQLSKSEIYRLIDEVFTFDGLHSSEYEIAFGSSEMPWLCSYLCSLVYMDFGGITLPPMTLSEFGNVLFSLKYFNAEVALATLRRIYSNRCQA